MAVSAPSGVTAAPLPQTSPDVSPEVSPDVPVSATDLRTIAANNSPQVVDDPTNPRFVASAFRVDAPTFSCGLAVSGDGGRGWATARPVPELPPGAERCYAPEIAFDRAGRLYYLFIGLHGDGNEPMGVFLTASTDHGRTFAAPWRVLGPENYQVRLLIDRSVGDRGRIHLVWLRASADAGIGALPSGDNPIVAVHSDDGGRTFSEAVRVSDSSRPRAVAPAAVLGPSGAIHVVYYDLVGDARDYQGLEGPTWDGNWAVVHTVSSDRGDSFRPGTVVDGGVVPPGRVMLIFTMPAPALAAGAGGRLVAAWPDARAGDPDVWSRWSADAGATWAPAVKVNDDASGRAVEQSLPRLAVAPGGRVDMVFLDRRNDTANLLNDAYYSWSGDGGATFAPNVRLSSRASSSRIGQRYQSAPARGLVEFGSRLGLVSRAGSAVAVWPDTRNSTGGTAQQDLFGAVVTFPGAGGEPGPGGGVSGSTVVAIAAAVAVAGASVGLWATRSRARRP